MKIILRYNPNKNNCKTLNHFENHWRTWEEDTTDDSGAPITVTKGIHPKLAAVEVVKIETTGGESIVVKDKGQNLFQLEGSKALQLNVLSDFLLGELKRKK